MKRFSMAMTWLAVAGLMTTVSCRKPVVGFTNGESRTVTVSAVTESGDGSKTSIEGLNVKWSENDQIKMNAESVLTLTEGAGSTMGRFAGEVKGVGPYRIGYPAGKTTYDGETLKLNIPDSWAYDADMKEIVPMVAYAADVDDDVYFRNAVNMLKLQLRGDDTDASKLTSIVLTSASSYLSGDISVTFDEGGNPTFAAIDGGSASKTMTVSFGEEGLQLKADEVKCVYIPLAKINGGDLTVRFDCANGRFMQKKVTADANFNGVNNMLSAPEFPVNATDKDHEYVDLGLPSGLLWATCNVGADSPEDYGWYFMWGSVTESGDPNCSWAKCPGNGGSGNYDATAFSTWKDANLTDDVLNSSVDAAHANWGGDWRMPTSAEWKELKDNTTSEWTTENGVAGRKFTSTKVGYTDRYIFLPAAGSRSGTSLYDAGSYGRYWSSSLLSSYPNYAYYGDFYSGTVNPQGIYPRCDGLTVRPVR